MDSHTNRPELDRQKDNRNAFTEQQRLDQETLNILAGRRVAQRRQAAVRVEDLIGILQMPQHIPTEKFGAAVVKMVPITGGEPPTEAEFNAFIANYNGMLDRHIKLIAEVNRVHQMLFVASEALRKRLTGDK